MSIRSVRPRPTEDVADARARFAEILAADPPGVSPASRAALHAPRHRAELGVVLLHGLTNAPPQWAPFAAELAASGIAVVVPRFPGHGYVDRETHAAAKVSADALLGCASDAIDVACGLATRVVVAGLSIGGAIAAWLALERADVVRTVAIVPFFGVRGLGIVGSRALANVLSVVPNLFVPWDPAGGAGQIPAYGYPKFPTRLLAENLHVGDDVVRRSRANERPNATVRFLLNAREPACDNSIAIDLARTWRATDDDLASLEILTSLPSNHDIIDPTNAAERVDRVYPTLRRLILGEDQAFG